MSGVLSLGIHVDGVLEQTAQLEVAAAKAGLLTGMTQIGACSAARWYGPEMEQHLVQRRHQIGVGDRQIDPPLHHHLHDADEQWALVAWHVHLTRTRWCSDETKRRRDT